MDLVSRRVNQKELYTPYLLIQIFKFSSLFKFIIQESCTLKKNFGLTLLELFPTTRQGSVNLRMAPSKKKLVKPKEVSLESPPKTELPKVELPKDESKLFDEDDELGTSTIPDLASGASEEEKIPLNSVWDHAIDTPFKHSDIHLDGQFLRKWVHYQNMDSMEQFFQWDGRHLAVRGLSTSYLEVPWDKTTLEYLKTNPTTNPLMLWKYFHHLVMVAQPISGDVFPFYFQRTLARSPGKSL